MLCCRAPLGYVVTMMLSSDPSNSSEIAFQLFFPRHSWRGCFTLLFPLFVA